MRPFQDLDVWKLGHEIVLDVYAITRTFPREELFALTSQMRRAAYSIPMNIVQGSVKTDSQFRQSLRTSLGSAAELEYQIMLACDLGYVTAATALPIVQKGKREQRMLVAFIKHLGVAMDGAATGGRQPMAESPFEWDQEGTT